MLHKLINRIVLISVIAFGAAGTMPAHAETVTFNLSSTHPNIVELRFYSQDRNHVWPNASQVYIIDDWDTHTYRLNCSWGENICYGAWVPGDGTYWGVGQDNQYSCSNCCLICDGRELRATNLSP